MKIQQKNTQIAKNAAQLFTIDSENGLKVEICNWGASIFDIQMHNKLGQFESVTLSHQDLDDYEQNTPYFGATIGRTAGRIRNSECQIDQKIVRLQSAPLHNLHGGQKAISHQIWQAMPYDDGQNIGVKLSIISPENENGYPGQLNIEVVYTVTPDNQIIMEYSAQCHLATLCNLTSHVYFNLSGNIQRNVANHQFQIASDHVIAMDEELIATDALWKSTCTANATNPFNFHQLTPLENSLSSKDERITQAKGLDHYFVLDQQNTDLASATLIDPISGRRLRVFTDQSCLVVYTYNYANQEKLKGGRISQPFDAICLEAQQRPQPYYENGDHPAMLFPGQIYRQRTAWKFDLI